MTPLERQALLADLELAKAAERDATATFRKRVQELAAARVAMLEATETRCQYEALCVDAVTGGDGNEAWSST